MTFFVQATRPGKPKSETSRQAALGYAGILVVFAVAQLFSFEEFLPLFDSFWLPGGTMTAYLLATSIVMAEVFALPFLLRMALSPAMRMVSMVLGWLVPLLWCTVAVWLSVTVNAVTNIGFLGTTIEVMPGWWAVCMTVALGILAAWASWGLWPLRKKSRKSRPTPSATA